MNVSLSAFVIVNSNLNVKINASYLDEVLYDKFDSKIKHVKYLYSVYVCVM